MQFRHAAAFALVGWYLLMPNLVPHSGVPAANIPSNKLFDLNAPLAKWRQWQAFDSAQACENERIELRDKLKINQKSAADFDVEQSGSLIFGRCIATDDPRLKQTE
jgi:hypothetical protein